MDERAYRFFSIVGRVALSVAAAQSLSSIVDVEARLLSCRRFYCDCRASLGAMLGRSETRRRCRLRAGSKRRILYSVCSGHMTALR